MYPDGRMNENAGNYKGMDRFKAREAIVEDLKEKGLLEKIEPHTLSAGHCYRCHTVIEPYLSRQWFVKMKPLAKPALEAVKKGKIKFHPKRWTKVYLNWMENIHDWCISRQIWWGHRIPLWHCLDCNKDFVYIDEEPKVCKFCNSENIKQEEDVLDTWFSSWLWPFATFYWPFSTKDDARETKNESPIAHRPSPIKAGDLNYFYPTSVLVTAPEIIFFWVARMVMAGYEFMGDLPFRDVYIHGTVRDIEGKKMSKSLGNIIDPLDIINEYGTDALRFSLISITAQGQDVFLSEERFQTGRNFANKIWNASRFIMMNLDPSVIEVDLCRFFKEEELSMANRWILSRFYSTLKETGKFLDNYKFNEAANALYGFFWHEFCDWYLELSKPEITKKENQIVLYKVLEKFLRTLHPFMPFITEEIWQKLPGLSFKETAPVNSIMAVPWPHVQENIIDKKSEHKMHVLFEFITLIRNMRSELEIPLVDLINIRISTTDQQLMKILKSMLVNLKNLAKINSIEFIESYSRQTNEYVSVLKDAHIAIPLSGLIDIDKYRQKIRGRMGSLEVEIKSKENMLANENFVKRAPEEVVEKERERLRELKETLTKLKAVENGL